MFKKKYGQPDVNLEINANYLDDNEIMLNTYCATDGHTKRITGNIVDLYNHL